MKAEKVVSVFEEYDLRRKKIYLFTGEDGRKFRRILLEKDRLTNDNVIYLRKLIEQLYKYGFNIPAETLEKWLEEKIQCEQYATK